MSLSAFVLLSIVLFYTVNVAKSLGSANVQRETLCIRKIVTFLTWRRSFVGRVLQQRHVRETMKGRGQLVFYSGD